MKKLLFSIAVMTVVATKGQSNQIGLSFMSSIPVGAFASTNNDPGFAKTGANFEISYTRLFNEKWGASVALRGMSNPFNTDEFVKQEQAALPGVAVSLSDANWSVSSWLLGGVYNISLSDKFTLQPQVMIGFAAITSPELAGSYIFSGSGATFIQKSASSGGFCYDLGAKINWHITKKFYLNYGLTFFHTSGSFSDVATTVNGISAGTTSFNQNISSINSGLGLGFRF